MRPHVSLRAAFVDPALLGNVLAGDSWRVAWRVLLVAATTGGRKWRALATLAAYLSGLCNHRARRAWCPALHVPDQRQAKITFAYCTAALGT